MGKGEVELWALYYKGFRFEVESGVFLLLFLSLKKFFWNKEVVFHFTSQALFLCEIPSSAKSRILGQHPILIEWGTYCKMWGTNFWVRSWWFRKFKNPVVIYLKQRFTHIWYSVQLYFQIALVNQLLKVECLFNFYLFIPRLNEFFF